MNNLIIIDSDSSDEEVIPSRSSQESSEVVEDTSSPINVSDKLSSDEIPEDSYQNQAELWSIWLQFFDHNTWWLLCGHIFHYNCICTQNNRLRVTECPLCKHFIDSSEEVIKLFVNPEELGSNKVNNLHQSNKRLEKQIRKLKTMQEKLQVCLEMKDKQVYLLQTLMKQHENNEDEIFFGKEVDDQTKEKYTEGIVHMCWQNDNCEYAHKFRVALKNVKRDSGFAIKCHNIVTIANRKYVKDAIVNIKRIAKEHKIDISLPFYIEKWRKLDYYVDMKEVNKRNNLFRFHDEVFEVIKDYGHGYDQEQIQKYKELVQNYQHKLIENNGINDLIDDPLALREDSTKKVYIYDKNKRKMMLDRACAQIMEKQRDIYERGKKIKKLQLKKKIQIESCRSQIEILKKQSKLLDEIEEYIVTREERFLYYETDQERILSKKLDEKERSERSRAKGSKAKTYRQWRSERFRKYKQRTRQNDIRGIHSSEKNRQDRSFKQAWDKIYYNQEIIDFEELFKTFKIFL